MSSRKTPFVNNEIYHIYNRGIDKRIIFKDTSDYHRFLESIIELNTERTFGGLYLKSFLDKNNLSNTKNQNNLVEIVAYCLNPNHFHFIIKQIADNGISQFMQRIGTGYTLYFNNKEKRSGSLFQGKFKSKHVDNNEQLLYLNAYVNLNDSIHGIDNTGDVVFSSFKEYTENMGGICEKSIILDQYKSKDDYKKVLKDSLPELIRQKQQRTELEG
jgi:REP element-mobilizing transposase RayT